MDRQEYREIISEIRTSYRNRDYERVIMFAQEIPAKKIKENNVLEMIANAYDQVGKPQLARTTLELAYRRMPNGKQTAYKMSVLSLKLKDIEGAVQYYEEFCKIAPNDNQRFILKYEIATEGGLSLYDRIRILEEYTEKETDDRWMYELARLYHEAGMADKCVQMCDDIVVWFSDGDYLKKALELKFAHKALSPTQQAMYERIMQEYIEDYEEPEPEPEETYEEFEEDAEEFANDFLGEAAKKNPLDGDTKPIGLPQETEALTEEESSEAFTEEPDPAAAAGPTLPEDADTEPKKTISISTIKGESADELAAEIATSIAKNGMAQPRADKKNIFYDFKLELSQPLKPVKKQEPAANENAQPEMVPAAVSAEKTAEEAPQEVLPEPDVQKPVSREAAFVSERLFAGEEKLPELKAEPEAMAYDPSAEAVVETPALEETFEHKKLEVSEGQVGISFDLLDGDEGEVEGQLSIDQLFQTYANNIENNLENRAAVARVEAERLKQIREAVESSMPSAAAFTPEEKTAEAPARAQQVIVEENTVSFQRPQTDETDEMAAPEADLKNTQIYSKDDVLNGVDEELKLSGNRQQKLLAEEEKPEETFRIEDEPELAYEDPVEKILREFEEQERAKEEARKAEIAAAEASRKIPEEKEIEIPAFLKNLQFDEPEEDLEEDLVLLDEPETAESAPEPEETAGDAEDAAETSGEEPAARPWDEDDLFDEIMSEVGEAAAAETEIAETPGKPGKTEEEIEAELDDLGDFLAEAMSFESSEDGAEETEPAVPEAVEEEAAPAETDAEAAQEDPVLEEILAAAVEEFAGVDNIPVKKLELTEDEELELDDLGDALADIFGDFEETEAADAPEEAVMAETEEALLEDMAEADETAGEDAAEAASAEEVAEADETAKEDAAEATPAEEVAEADETAGEEEAEAAPAEEVAEADETAGEDAAEAAPAEEVTEADETAGEEEAEAAPAEEVTEADETAEEDEAEAVPAEEAAEADETAEEDTDEDVAEELAKEIEEALAEAEAEETLETAEETEETGEVPAETADAPDADPAETEAEVEVEETIENVNGDTQPMERIHPFTMSREMREELAEFLLVNGMDDTITNTINNIILTRRSGDPTGGHLIITGDKKIGKTFLTISIIKAINIEFNSGSGKVAKVQSDSLNGKDIGKVFQKIAGNDLIIENVGDLEEPTLSEILEVMSSGMVQDMVVFEGNMLALDTIINNHPEVKTLFKNRIDVSELTITQWADVACDYAKRQGYRVGDMALLALHAKIDEINMPTTRFGYEDIVNIMETAIERCDKRNTGKLFSAFSKKEGEEIELNESDFI